MFCFKARKLIIPYSEGTLDPKRARAVAQHLERCPKCAEELSFVQIAGDAIRDAKTPAAEPAADLWSRIEREIAHQNAPVRPRWRPQGFHLAGAAAAACLLLVVVLTNNTTEPGKPRVHRTETAQAENVHPGTPAPDASPNIVKEKTTVTVPPVAAAVDSAPKPPSHRTWRPAPRRVEVASIALEDAPEPRPVPRAVMSKPAPSVAPPPATDETSVVASASTDIDGRAMSLSELKVEGKYDSDEVKFSARYSYSDSTPTPSATRVYGSVADGSAVGTLDECETAPADTTVDLMNNADEDSRVSALFCYP